MTRHLAPLALLLCLAGTPGEAQAPAVNDAEAQKATVMALRNVGTAMFAWFTDQVAAAAAATSAEKPTATNPKTISVSDYPVISATELRALLVPNYIAELPEKDGWGHALEFRLNRADPTAAHIMLIRSPGKDGTFETGSYNIGPYEVTAYANDLVWADGYFITWPMAAK